MKLKMRIWTLVLTSFLTSTNVIKANEIKPFKVTSSHNLGDNEYYCLDLPSQGVCMVPEQFKYVRGLQEENILIKEQLKRNSGQSFGYQELFYGIVIGFIGSYALNHKK